MTSGSAEIARRFTASARQLRLPASELPANLPGDARSAVVTGARRGLCYLSAEVGGTIDIWYGEGHAVFFARGDTLDSAGEGMVVAAPGVEVAFGQLVVDLTGVWPVGAASSPVVVDGMDAVASAVTEGVLVSALTVASPDPRRLWVLGFVDSGLISGVVGDEQAEVPLEPVAAYDAWVGLRRAALGRLSAPAASG